MHTPTQKMSQYHLLLKEVETKSGVFNDKNWDGSPIEMPYCPPWRQTLTDLYGAEAYKKITAPVEEYEARVSRIADEEAARRRGTRWPPGVRAARSLTGAHRRDMTGYAPRMRPHLCTD